MNKLTAIVIILVVLLVLIGGGVFYWLKTHSPLDISEEAVRNACQERIKNATDEELMEEVRNLKYAEETDPVTGEERITLANKKMIDYLVCRLEFLKDEDFYNKAKDMIEGMSIQEENKQNNLNRLNDIFLEETEVGFIIELALGDINKVCPDKLTSLCVDKLQEKNTKESSCLDYCKLINEYQTDEERFNREIIDYNYWSQQSLSGILATGVTKDRVSIRLAIVLRLKGQDMAGQFCQTLPETKLADAEITIKDFCFERLDTIINLIFCEELRDEISGLICAISE